MSADAWRVCPQCKINKEREAVEKFAAAAQAGGKDTPDVFLFLLNEARSFNSEPKESLREDYEIYTNEDGQFYVVYRAICTVCGFEHRFNHQEQLGLNPKGTAPVQKPRRESG